MMKLDDADSQHIDAHIFDWFDPALSILSFTAIGCKLSPFANLFALCKRCIKHAWPLARIILCVKTYSALSSMGRTHG